MMYFSLGFFNSTTEAVKKCFIFCVLFIILPLLIIYKIPFISMRDYSSETRIPTLTSIHYAARSILLCIIYLFGCRYYYFKIFRYFLVNRLSLPAVIAITFILFLYLFFFSLYLGFYFTDLNFNQILQLLRAIYKSVFNFNNYFGAFFILILIPLFLILPIVTFIRLYKSDSIIIRASNHNNKIDFKSSAS